MRLSILFTTILLLSCASQRHASNGWELIKSEQYDLAIKEFETAKSHGDLPGVYLGLSRAYLKKKNLKKSL